MEIKSKSLYKIYVKIQFDQPWMSCNSRELLTDKFYETGQFSDAPRPGMSQAFM